MKSLGSDVLLAITQELKRLFDFDCQVIYVEGLINSNERYCRGLYSPKTRTIRVSLHQSPLQIIETFCHEIVHFKQHKLGILKGTDEHAWYKGVWYSWSMPYKDQPWEHDANKYMPLMFDRFCHKASRSLCEKLRELDVEYQQKTLNACQRASVKELGHV